MTEKPNNPDNQEAKGYVEKLLEDGVLSVSDLLQIIDRRFSKLKAGQSVIKSETPPPIAPKSIKENPIISGVNQQITAIFQAPPVTTQNDRETGEKNEATEATIKKIVSITQQTFMNGHDYKAYAKLQSILWQKGHEGAIVRMSESKDDPLLTVTIEPDIKIVVFLEGKTTNAVWNYFEAKDGMTRDCSKYFAKACKIGQDNKVLEKGELSSTRPYELPAAGQHPATPKESVAEKTKKITDILLESCKNGYRQITTQHEAQTNLFRAGYKDVSIRPIEDSLNSLLLVRFDEVNQIVVAIPGRSTATTWQYFETADNSQPKKIIKTITPCEVDDRLNVTKKGIVEGDNSIF